MEINENIYTSQPNLWDTMKALLRRKFTALSAQVKKLERSYTNILAVHLRVLEQIKQIHPKGVEGNRQTHHRNQPNRNIENNTMNQQNQKLVL